MPFRPDQNVPPTPPVAEATASGLPRLTIGPGGVRLTPRPAPPKPLPPGQEWREIGAEILPAAGAIGASALVPGSGLVPVLLRLATSLAGGTSGEFGAQALRGDRLDPEAALGMGTTQAALNLPGELIGGLSRATGKGMVGSAYRVTKPAALEAVEMASALKGQKVPYHEADLLEQAIREKVVPGKPIIGGREGTGSIRIEKLMSQPMEELKRTVSALDKTVAPVTRQTFGGSPEIQALKNDLLSEGDNSAIKIGSVNKMLRVYLDEGRPALKGGKQGAYPRMSPSKVLEQKRYWQEQADNASAYARENKTSVSLRGRMAEALAKAHQRWLEELTPPSRPGGVGKIAESNRRYRSLLPLQTAVESAEMPRADVGFGLDRFNPIRYLPARYTGRAGLALARQAPPLLRQLPRSAWTLADLLESMQSDSTEARR